MEGKANGTRVAAAGSPLHARLQHLGVLSASDRDRLDTVLRRTRGHRAGEMLQVERSPYRHTHVVLRGWAIRFKTLPDGERQIVNFVLPGETIGLFGALFDFVDHAIEFLTDCETAEIPVEELVELFGASPSLAVALCWIGGQDERILEQHLVRLGRMPAEARIAHLLLELEVRLLRNGVEPGEALHLPLPQALLADALGMSHVHANRCCRKLREEGLIESVNGTLRLRDRAGLARLSGFDGGYLGSGGLSERLRQHLDLPDGE